MGTGLLRSTTICAFGPMLILAFNILELVLKLQHQLQKILLSLKLAFSTSYGYLAFDNPELDNSVYTSILSNSFKTKDLTIQQIFQQTWNKVFNKTKQRQSPSQHYGAALYEIILK